LAGLLDSDGSVYEPTKRVRFHNTSQELRDAAAELARSLGEQVTLTQGWAKGYGKVVMSYNAGWTPTTVPFAASVKASRSRVRTKAQWHAVTRIERIESVPTRCIGVDSPTRTFLCGLDMMPTHNTGLHGLERYVPTSAEYRWQVALSANAAGSGFAGIPDAPVLDFPQPDYGIEEAVIVQDDEPRREPARARTAGEQDPDPTDPPPGSRPSTGDGGTAWPKVPSIPKGDES
jgi:hypothetical protein